MNQLKTFCTRLSLACAVALFTATVCAAQTPAAAPAAPDKDKPAAPAASTKASTTEEELAKTPAGKAVAKFFAAINSGDIKQMRAFHESTGGNPANADKDFEVYERTGGLKLHRLSPRDAKDTIAVLVQTKKDARWLTFEFTVGTEDPYPIRGINVEPSEAPAN